MAATLERVEFFYRRQTRRNRLVHLRSRVHRSPVPATFIEEGSWLMRGPNTDAAKHKEIALYNTETWLYEDFQIGERVRSIRRTISEGESMAFNALVMDMHPYVADDVFAKEEGFFGRRIVAGAFVFSLGLG